MKLINKLDLRNNVGQWVDVETEDLQDGDVLTFEQDVNLILLEAEVHLYAVGATVKHSASKLVVADPAGKVRVYIFNGRGGALRLPEGSAVGHLVIDRVTAKASSPDINKLLTPKAAPLDLNDISSRRKKS